MCSANQVLHKFDIFFFNKKIKALQQRYNFDCKRGLHLRDLTRPLSYGINLIQIKVKHQHVVLLIVNFQVLKALHTHSPSTQVFSVMVPD